MDAEEVNQGVPCRQSGEESLCPTSHHCTAVSEKRESAPSPPLLILFYLVTSPFSLFVGILTKRVSIQINSAPLPHDSVHCQEGFKSNTQYTACVFLHLKFHGVTRSSEKIHNLKTYQSSYPLSFFLDHFVPALRLPRQKDLEQERK